MPCFLSWSVNRGRNGTVLGRPSQPYSNHAEPYSDKDLNPLEGLHDWGHSCTRVRGRPVALHVSQQISSESWGFLGVAAVSRYTPLKGPVAPVALELPGVSHVKLPPKRCRATGGV